MPLPERSVYGPLFSSLKKLSSSFTQATNFLTHRIVLRPDLAHLGRVYLSGTMATSFVLPLPYRLFFLVIEPIGALAGAVCAHFLQHDYLQMTHAHSAPTSAEPIPTVVSVVLSQLANMYLLFTLNEALVLRSTSDLRVWKTLLFGLLVADFGHLWSLRPLGSQIYWDVSSWGPMDIGNVPVVYLGAGMRMAFLLGVGLGSGKPVVGEAKATAKAKAK